LPGISQRERSYPIDVTAGPKQVQPRVAAIGPTQVRKRLSERRDENLLQGVVFVARREHADAPHAVALLRARRERPSRAQKRDKIPPSHERPPTGGTVYHIVK